MHSYASSPLLRGTYQDPLTIRRHTASRRGGGQPWGAGLLAPGANASVERASTRASTAPSSSLSMIDSIPAIGLGESIPSLNELSATDPRSELSSRSAMPPRDPMLPKFASARPRTSSASLTPGVISGGTADATTIGQCKFCGNEIPLHSERCKFCGGARWTMQARARRLPRARARARALPPRDAYYRARA